MSEVTLSRRLTLQAITALGFSAVMSRDTLSMQSQLQQKPWQLRYFDPEEFHIVARIADIILPQGETLGALDVSVDKFIDYYFANCVTDEIKPSLSKWRKHWKSKNKIDFLKQNSAMQTTCVKELDAKPDKEYTLLKNIVLLGYFSSEKVIKQLTNYHSIPQKFEGDIPTSNDPRIYVDHRVRGNS